MSDLSKRIDVHANVGLLIQQWQQAPRMRALVDALQGVMDDHLIRPLGEMEERLRIDIAEGFWLDCIGERLILPRPATDIANFASFGFHGSDGVGFDQGPFATVVEALSPRVPVGDEFYRKLLMMRAEALLADGTVERLSDAVGHVFPGVSYRDGGDMTAEVQGAYQGLDSRSLLEALDIAGGLPSPAGVELSRVVWEYVVGGDCGETSRRSWRVVLLAIPTLASTNGATSRPTPAATVGRSRLHRALQIRQASSLA